MNKLNLHTANKADDNFIKLAELFPNAVTETIVDGVVTRAIDKDVLVQEISAHVVEGNEERYQFTWPDKKKSVLLANAPNYKTLRPYPNESVNFDTTENLYIEGDNLDVLKLLQETYLGKVKMIYIDPPYNTGKDFVYSDKFAVSSEEWGELSGDLDEDGNRLFINSETNGRYHTDWLNMIYPRLRLAKDLLQDDGVIFISIDDNEVENLKKVCNEVFGAWNFVACITRATGTPTGGGFEAFVNEVDYILAYAKKITALEISGFEMSEEDAKIYNLEDKYGKYLIRPLRRTGGEDRREDRPSMFFPIKAPDGTDIVPLGPTGYESRWICGKKKYDELCQNHLIEWKQVEKNGQKTWQVYQRFYLENRTKQPGNLWNNIEGNKKATRDIRNIFEGNKVFDFPKPLDVIKKIISISAKQSDIILDFFSGSATTAHAVMQLNAEDGGNRKFIMVQLPEEIDEKHEAYKAGYRTICDIGKERIRRAGAKIKDEKGLDAQNLDIGFRVLKCDSTNMKDVYYYPTDIDQNLLDMFTSNIKDDRTPEDLLFQVMLDLGVLLSCKIQKEAVDDKNIFVVYQGDVVYLIACFDQKVSSEVVTAIAKRKPYYAVFRDSSMENDSLMTSFEQIFEAYSKDTVRKVL